jgi:hypothetical protein
MRGLREIEAGRPTPGIPVFASNPVSEFIINTNQEKGGEIMDSQRRTNLLGGIVLILVGGILLAAQLFPGLGITLNITLSWPLILVGVGIFLFLLGLLINEPDMAVPACIVAGIGGILYYQNETGDWASWAYAWALIPGFVGVGTILAGLFGGNFRKSLRDGGTLILISVILFAIFSSLLGGKSYLGVYWPVLIILLGVWLLIRPLFK